MDSDRVNNCGSVTDNGLLTEINNFSENRLDQIKRLTRIGTALSAEKDINRLLEMIVDEGRRFSNADAGTLYVMSDDETELRFAIVQNSSLKIRMGGTGGIITWPAVSLKDEDGSLNNRNVSAYVANSGDVVNIIDVYHAHGFNFQGTKEFDNNTGYRSKSMLVVPLRNHENDIIGVLQLLNALDPVTGEVVSFSVECQEITISLASQAAVALSHNRLIGELENLLESFIKTIARAIDEKSPYTGGHVRRVAELTMAMAHKINSVDYGKFADIKISEDELRELRIAAWLHDIGKITTPEYIVDKATKLETIHDRIHDVKTRIELIKCDYLANKNKDGKNEEILSVIDPEIRTLDEEYRFLQHVNQGAEFLGDEMINRIKKIAERHWTDGGRMRPLLSDEEVAALCIRRGTLTENERSIINNHALLTSEMLTRLPFPRKLRHVADYAAAHHENIDGSGYPLGLKGDQIPLQAKIIAIADVFEALTAKDRPYKKGKSVAEALGILEKMVTDNQIDASLYDLFIREKVYEDYVHGNAVPDKD